MIDVRGTEYGGLFKMPKNIRQIGQGEENKKVYVEDYVMTYIKQLSLKAGSEYRYAVLLGQFITISQSGHIFISGAVEMNGIAPEDGMCFSNDVWTSIYEDIKENFTDVEIVGWCVLRAGLPLEPKERLSKIHIDNFSGQNKVMMLYECLEKEEVFYVYEENALKKQEGYYVYYEKNEDMQNYMISQNQKESVDGDYQDNTVKEIKKIINEKKNKKVSLIPRALLYTAGTLAAVVALIWGSAVLSGYDKMTGIEKTLSTISTTLSKVEATKPPKEEITEVETLAGSITTIKQEDIVGDDINMEEISESTQTEETLKATQKPEKDAAKEAEEKPKVKETADETEQKTDETEQKVDETEQKADKPEGKTDKTAEEVSAAAGGSYIIKQGDTLADISLKIYHTMGRILEIQELNGIEDQNKIFAGQKIKLPQ